MEKNKEIIEEDVQFYDKTDDFDENCDSLEDETIYVEEADYELPSKWWESENCIAIIALSLMFIFSIIVFILCALIC